jgi:UDP-N-acetylglucosamine--N-acetylmuramyl-(pentapeptide) pyrophosphoryl-undecaprenol N-acetylglucosamine transferase
MKKRRIVLAGWGTGGHVFPIQSILIHLDTHYAQQIDHVRWYGSRDGLEHTIFQQTNCKNIYTSFVHSIAGKFRRETRILSWLKNVRDIFLFLMGMVSAFRFLSQSGADVVFCKWGFVALPIVLAAAVKRIPIIVHESDTKPWLTNRVASWFATKTFVAFPNVLSKAEVVGQILSDAIIPSDTYPENKILAEVIKDYNKKKTYIAIIGWSQWSQRLYQMLVDILSYNKTIAKSYIFLVVGWFHTDNQSFTFSEKADIYWLGFCSQQDMSKLLSIVDMSITRAGTTSLAEQQLYNIKKIIIPISWTHDQYANADRYRSKYHDIVVDTKIPNYLETIDLTLQQYLGYKKKIPNETWFDNILIIKDIVAKALL